MMRILYGTLVLLLIATAANGEATYRVDGLPLDYALGSTYEVTLTVSDPDAVTGSVITTTNGSLSAVDEFGEGEAHELQFGAADNGWSFFWQAPADAHELGEGEAEFSITFAGEDDSIWASYETVVRPPPIHAEDKEATPAWALQLAWGGVALTGILVLAAVFVLRRG